MNKKAQLIMQILVFVIGLIIIGLVLLFGYSELQNLNERRCDTQRIQFGTQLLNEIQRNRGIGTSTVVQLGVPCEVEQVCFAGRNILTDNQGLGPTSFSGTVRQTTQNIIISSIQTNTQELRGDQTNVWTVTTTGIVEPIERFSTESAPIQTAADSILCVDAQRGNIRVRLQGQGQTTRVLEAP